MPNWRGSDARKLLINESGALRPNREKLVDAQRRETPHAQPAPPERTSGRSARRFISERTAEVDQLGATPALTDIIKIAVRARLVAASLGAVGIRLPAFHGSGRWSRHVQHVEVSRLNACDFFMARAHGNNAIIWYR